MNLNLTRKAYDFLGGLPSKQYKQVASKMLSLQKEPFPNDCKHLSGHPGFRRVDIGEYRICYSVVQECIQIIAVGNRNDGAAYKQLS